MRLTLLAMLAVCMAGFAATSGTITLDAGRVLINPSVLSHTLPVLVALAAPMITMVVILLVTVTLGRPAIGRPSAGKGRKSSF